jgi:tetratricopeptide (TPR) repeat protein
MMLRNDDLRFQAVIQLLDSARYKDALPELDRLQAVLTAEDRVAALFWKICCLTWLGDVKEARRCVEEALATVDSESPLRICLKFQSAFLLDVEEGPDKAAREIRSLLQRYAEQLKSEEFFWIYVQAKTYLGGSLSLSGQYSEATKELEEALSLETQPLARYYLQFWLGDAYYHLGELDKAREHLKSGLAQAPSVPRAGFSKYHQARLAYELALIDHKERRLADARRHLELASNAGAEDPDLLRAIDRFNVVVRESDLR